VKKSLVFAVGAVASASLVLTGCGGDDSTSSAPKYDVTGKVDTKWIEYECKNLALSMDNVAFVESSKPKKDKDKKDKKKEDKGDTSTKKPSSTPTASAPAPVRVSPGQVPKGDPKKPKNYDSKYCTTEYELFIKNGDDIFEQDVPYSHYIKCEEDEKFSSCAA
jgi:hypothetical protein